MEVQIGKYKRPGVFIEEFDASQIEAPIVEGISTMVIGFSKKGPINRPIRLQSQSDLNAIFGPLDRNLEKKGSYFHRTVSKMLESSPVFAMNLLNTDDNLDTIEYKSLSTSTSLKNDIKRSGPYRRFHDTTGFWTKDTESFINLVSDNPSDEDRVFHITNMSDKNITVFTFKSDITGYDISLLDWYGGVEKVPSYLYPTDYASDYLVDVVVVSGDWTDYAQLAVDSRWGQYFNTSGLIKSQVTNFYNDANVTSLALYQGTSLIPYFRDEDGRNIFIENVINRDTNRTGLFCAYDSDALETDLPNGLIDLVGNNLMKFDNDRIKDIEFLSYKDSIVETETYERKDLDTPGNVISFGDLYKNNANIERTANFAEGYIANTSFIDPSFPGTTGSGAPAPTGTFDFTIDIVVATDAYVVIGGQKIDLTPGTESFTIQASDFDDIDDGTTASDGSSYMAVFTVNTNGDVEMLVNSTNDDKIAVGATDVVLGYVYFSVINISGTKHVYNMLLRYVSIDDNGFIEFATTNSAPGIGDEILVDTDTNGGIIYEFLGTSGNLTTADYEENRRIKFFNYMLNYLDSPNKNKMVLVIDDDIKKSMENMTVSDIVTSTSQNKELKITTNLPSSDLEDLLGTGSPNLGINLCMYIIDDEFVMGTESLTTKETPFDTGNPEEGIVARYSSFYEDYINGQINTGNYFNENVLPLGGWTVEFLDVSGDDFIKFTYTGSGTTPSITFNANDKIQIPDSVLNSNIFTVIDGIDQSVNGAAVGGDYAFSVTENTSAETITDVEIVYDTNNKHYLKMYKVGDVVNVEFVDDALTSSNPIVDLTLNDDIFVISQKTNFKQTVEIEMPSGYTSAPNKILVDAERYTEVKIGDYLEAKVDISALEPNEVPKNITRILSKRRYAPDNSLVEITTSREIMIRNFNGDLQTNRITKIGDYINTYKGITLKGFRVRQDSMPDGTETRQQEIMSNIERGSNLFKALINKEAINFRYLIDSFGLGLTEFSKQELVDVVGERLDAFAFLNMPSMKSFKNSENPTFVNDEGVLQTEFIAQGGDPQSSPAFLYSFAEGKGVSASGYFAPYVVVNDNGRPIDVPPAMYVASTYMRKLNANQTNILPWTIVAGINNGQITGIADLEQDFNNEDIVNLNQMSANPIVRKRNRGFVIETQNTAQTLLTSALSFINVREVLIELEQELADMLLQFQWKFNTPEVRAEIKLRADLICASYVNRNGLFDYFNKIDEENNTAEIIDNQMGVLDTRVEPIKGMGIIVNNITIMRTNSIQIGGFQ